MLIYWFGILVLCTVLCSSYLFIEALLAIRNATCRLLSGEETIEIERVGKYTGRILRGAPSRHVIEDSLRGVRHLAFNDALGTLPAACLPSILRCLHSRSLSRDSE